MVSDPSHALLGDTVPNLHYLGQRLLYEKPPEPSFDPLNNTQYLHEMFKHAAIIAVLFFVGWIVTLPIFLIMSAANGKLGVVLWTLGFLVTALALASAYWLIPLPAQLSEWKFSVDGKGPAGFVAFEHITWALRQRETPIRSIRVRRLSMPGQQKRDYLELRDGIFVGYVSCFPYGRDLYIGWTFWLYLSPARFLLMALARLWQEITFRGTEMYVRLRYDSAKAMREAMHSAAREGIDVAAGQIEARGQGSIGSEVPVDIIDESKGARGSHSTGGPFPST